MINNLLDILVCGIAYWSFVLKFKAVQQYSSIEYSLIHTCLLSNIGYNGNVVNDYVV